MHGYIQRTPGLESEIMGGELHVWIDDEPDSVIIGRYVELRECR